MKIGSLFSGAGGLDMAVAGVKPQSLMRQLNRYGIKASDQLQELVQGQKRGNKR